MTFGTQSMINERSELSAIRIQQTTEINKWHLIGHTKKAIESSETIRHMLDSKIVIGIEISEVIGAKKIEQKNHMYQLRMHVVGVSRWKWIRKMEALMF